MIFKCKNCGGNTVYSPEHKSMFCRYCDSVNSEVRKHDLYNIQLCPECAGELVIREYASAMQCPYCDNYIILNERVEGDYLPHKLIPFKYSKNMVKNLLKERFKKTLFAPTDFLSEARLDSMTGEYVPFWMYDYNTSCVYEGEGTKVRSWTSGNYRYTETSYYRVVRDLNVLYNDIPVDASLKMADSTMDLMEPYDYKELVPFAPEYMSGFNGEKYNIASGELANRAEVKTRSSAEKILQQNLGGYSGLRQKFKEIKPTNTAVNYCLLPVWEYIYEYKGIKYPFYVNGQTGKIVGKAPISKEKVWAYGATLWGALTTIILLGGFLLTNFM